MKNGIHYICSAGVMLESQGKKILIDALIHHEHMLFNRYSPELERQIIKGEGIFEQVDLFLSTHHHQDHFEPNLVAEFLKNHPDTPFVGPEQSVQLLRPLAPEQARIIEVNPAVHKAENLNIKGVQFKALRLVHSGKDYVDTKNMAYILHFNDIVFAHTGDAAQDSPNTNALAEYCPEQAVIIAPFPYMTLPLAHKKFKNATRPRCLFAMHLPRPEKDQGGWIKAAHAALEKQHDPELDIILAENPGDFFLF